MKTQFLVNRRYHTDSYQCSYSLDSVRTFNVYTKSMSTSMKNFHKFGFGLFPYNSTVKFTAKIIGRYYSVGSYLDIRRNITYGYEALAATNTYLFLN